MSELSRAILFLIPVAILIGLFALLAIVGVARERRRERESLYRHETARKLVESGQMSFEQFSAFERAEAERPLAARRRAFTLAGAILTLGGLSTNVALRELSYDTLPAVKALAELAYIPIGIGAGMLLHAGGTVLHAAVAGRIGRKQ